MQQMQRTRDGKWYHGCSFHDGYVIAPVELVEKYYQTWLSSHRNATEEIKEKLKNLIFSADLWDVYAQVMTDITILEVYAIVEEQPDSQWHLCYRFLGKTIMTVTVDEESLNAWLLHEKAKQFLQSGSHPLSGVYMLPCERP